MSNILGTRLKERRLLKKLTLEQLGTIVGVQKSAVSKWERGKNIPKGDILLKLCNVLECTADYLTGRTNTPTSNYYSYLDDKDGLIEMEYDSPYKLTQKEFELFIEELKETGYDVEALLNKVKKEASKKD